MRMKRCPGFQSEGQDYCPRLWRLNDELCIEASKLSISRQDEGYQSVPFEMSPHFNATRKFFDNDDDESAKGKGLEGEKAFCFTS